VTYRLEGHSTSDDPRAYRPPELVEPWRRKDPILRLARYLEWRGALTPAGAEAARASAREQIRKAVEGAESHAPRPALETLFEGVYAEPLWQQREQLEELRAAVDEDPRVTGARPGQGQGQG
jgi:2-oxoisovalerate dehydrogenase E1 component alpha subunit